MRVIAATFQDEAAAEHVLGRLRDAYELGARDAELAPLGAVDSDAGPQILLAGRFHDDRAAPVRELIQRSGGHVVVDVDETVTKRRDTPIPASRAEDAAPERTLAKGGGAPARAFF